MNWRYTDTHLNRLPKENRETFELSKEKIQTFRDKLETAERERSMRIREVWENLFFGEIKRYRQEMTYQKKRSNAPPVTRRRPVFNKEGLCSWPASYRFLVLWVVFLLPTFQVNTWFFSGSSFLLFSRKKKIKEVKSFFFSVSAGDGDCSSIELKKRRFMTHSNWIWIPHLPPQNLFFSQYKPIHLPAYCIQFSALPYRRIILLQYRTQQSHWTPIERRGLKKKISNTPALRQSHWERERERVYIRPE